MPVKVLIVDDSALMRKILTNIFSSDRQLEVVGAAADAYKAREMIKEHNPDVLTLDIEMPKMDGLAFLEKIMTLRPMPVIMISSLTQRNAEATFKALEIGAVDFFPKPILDIKNGISDQADELIKIVKAAANIKVGARSFISKKQGNKDKNSPHPAKINPNKIVVIGASIGGVEAIRQIISELPVNCPPILIVQHMPESFTSVFAQRLNKYCALPVLEAKGGALIETGCIYIASGDRHLKIKKRGNQYYCQLSNEDPVYGHRPSVDTLFKSAAKEAGGNAIGLILTGMGKDGAMGMLEMRNAGAVTLGQDEQSCAVYGMPRAAYNLGAVVEQTSIDNAVSAIIHYSSKQ